MKIRSEFTVASWEQVALDGIHASQPIMRVSAVFEPSGEMKGQFAIAYLMYYQRNDENDAHNAQARYTGYIVFDGEFCGKSGSFAMEDNGIYADAMPSSSLTIIEYSGTNDFCGIRGVGKYYADCGKMVIEIDCTLGDAE